MSFLVLLLAHYLPLQNNCHTSPSHSYPFLSFLFTCPNHCILSSSLCTSSVCIHSQMFLVSHSNICNSNTVHSAHHDSFILFQALIIILCTSFGSIKKQNWHCGSFVVRKDTHWMYDEEYLLAEVKWRSNYLNSGESWLCCIVRTVAYLEHKLFNSCWALKDLTFWGFGSCWNAGFVKL